MVAEPPPGGSLTDDELRDLAKLLARYASHDIDQFDHWRVETSYGAVFIEIANQQSF